MKTFDKKDVYTCVTAEEEYLEDEYYANDYHLENNNDWYEEDDLHNWNNDCDYENF